MKRLLSAIVFIVISGCSSVKTNDHNVSAPTFLPICHEPENKIELNDNKLDRTTVRDINITRTDQSGIVYRFYERSNKAVATLITLCAKNKACEEQCFCEFYMHEQDQNACSHVQPQRLPIAIFDMKNHRCLSNCYGFADSEEED